MWVLILLKTFFSTPAGGVSSVAGNISVYSVASDFSAHSKFYYKYVVNGTPS